MNQEQNTVKSEFAKPLSNAQILCLICRYNATPHLPYKARLDKMKNRIVIGYGSGHRIDIGIKRLRTGLEKAAKIASNVGVQS